MTVLVRAETPWDLTAERLETVLAEVACRLEGQVETAYVFGSCATGQFRKDSDIDLILVTETDLPFTRRALRFGDLLDIHPRMDILVYSPDEFKRMTESPDNGFWRRATSQMRRIV